MASNLATARLLARLPSRIPVIEIADDVYVCDEVFVPEIRTALANQPQIQYFLDRDIRADEVLINDLGDRAWALRHSTAPVVTTLTVIQNAGIEKIILPGKIERVKVTGFVKAESSLRLVEHYYKAKPADILRIGTERSTTVYRRVFGPYPVGHTRSVSFKVPAGYGGPVLNDGDLGADIFQNPHVVRLGVTDVYGPATDVAVTKPEVTLRTGLVMIAGPAISDYAELFPGFQWILGKFPAVGERMKAVVDHIKLKDNKVDVKKFEDALPDMMANSDSSFILFKGSGDFDPIKMWPLAVKALGGNLDTLKPDGGTLTAEGIARGKKDWRSDKWCLTIAGKAVSENEMRMELGQGVGPVTIKPSGDDVAHVSDGEGTVTMPFLGLTGLIAAYRTAGRAVTVIDSPFEGARNFDKEAWAAVVAATTADDIPGASTAGVTDRGDLGGLGESMCIRLLSEPMFSPDEEAMVLPTLSPQYFWSTYARKAPKLPPGDIPPEEQQAPVGP